MKLVYEWLKEFVQLPASASPEELRGRFSLSGTAVDSIDPSAAGPVLDVELTANRGDCMGHYGLAREAAALYGVPLRTPAPDLRESAEGVAAATRVEIECPELCGRYTARVLRGVKIAPSPDWLRQRLEAIGQSSINNVVDATNYVMFELGHPLHAFDLDTLAEKRIVVRRARAGETMRTLDGLDRKLAPEMCVIADARRAVAIGGVMGGAETQISATTRNLLLECAWFEPISLRRTSKKLGLRTEASQRFERGADPELADLASRRCAELIVQLAGGEVLSGVIDVYPDKPRAVTIELTRREMLRLLGADVPDRDVEQILKTLGFEPVRVDTARGSAGSLMAAWECRRPSWRSDVARTVDLIEEVARHYGLEKFPARLPAAKQAAARQSHAEDEDSLRELLVGLGYREIISITHVDAGRDEIFRTPNSTPVRIANPIAEDASLMRSTGVVTMTAAVEWNLNHGQRNVRLFEIGRRYAWNRTAPVETRILTLGVTGVAREKSIVESEREYRFEDLKGDLERVGDLAGGFGWTAGGPAWLESRSAASVALAAGAATLGCAGQLSRQVAERLKIRQDVFLAEISLDPFYGACDGARERRRYRPISRFPAVERDFSLLLADGTTFGGLADSIRALGIGEIARIEAVDLFRGKGVPEGQYSLLIRVTFQSSEATLTDARMAEASARIVKALESLGARLRVA
ncbi:MAG: phenylalanine--tRNA ligase subunit beta [Candidatus Acidiferrales bacterium]